MKVIAIGGEPGSGKTTLMKEVLAAKEWKKCYDAFKLVPYLQYENCYILGKYDEGEVFSGTDRMSMAVQPEAIKFLASLPASSILIYEGDRLFTASFLEHCVDNYDCEIVYLETDRSIREDRYKERGSAQNETWLQGRETKISNILGNMSLMFNTVKFKNNNKDDQKKIVDYISTQLF
jgi:broad-specificity NMP kinase